MRAQANIQLKTSTAGALFLSLLSRLAEVGGEQVVKIGHTTSFTTMQARLLLGRFCSVFERYFDSHFLRYSK